METSQNIVIAKVLLLGDHKLDFETNKTLLMSAMGLQRDPVVI